MVWSMKVIDTAKIMTTGRFRHLPVAGDAGLVGVVDITDVCRALIDADVSPVRHGPCGTPGRYLACHPQRQVADVMTEPRRVHLRAR